MHKYYICNMADFDIYQKQCAALEKHIPELVKVEELHDVDDSRYMLYQLKEYKITVKNSFYMDAVYVESEIPLEPFFAD